MGRNNNRSGIGRRHNNIRKSNCTVKANDISDTTISWTEDALIAAKNDNVVAFARHVYEKQQLPHTGAMGALHVAASTGASRVVAWIINASEANIDGCKYGWPGRVLVLVFVSCPLDSFCFLFSRHFALFVPLSLSYFPDVCSVILFFFSV